MEIKVNATNYEPNSIDDNWPREVPVERGGFASYLETLQGDKRRVRAESFKDHFSQATLFWNSQSDVEKEHIVAAFGFELAKVTRPAIRERVLAQFANVDAGLASQIAAQLGMRAPVSGTNAASARNGAPPASPALSILNNPGDGSIKGRKIAILAADGVDGAAADAMKSALAAKGAQGLVVAPHLGTLAGSGNEPVAVDHTIVTMPSAVFDAVYVSGGLESARTLGTDGDAVHFVAEAYKHAKAVACSGEGLDLLREAGVGPRDGSEPDPALGVIVANGEGAVPALIEAFIATIGRHRVWARPDKAAVPA